MHVLRVALLGVGGTLGRWNLMRGPYIVKDLSPKGILGSWPWILSFSAFWPWVNDFARHMFPPWWLALPQAQSNDTGTSEAVRQNKPFLFLRNLSRVFHCNNGNLTNTGPTLCSAFSHRSIYLAHMKNIELSKKGNSLRTQKYFILIYSRVIK
jgi:hypothetical protein